MDIESVRSLCLALPNVTEKVQWDNDLLFCIGGKMFAVVCLEAAALNKLSFKCTPEKFAELVDQADIIPAPYVARYHWVTLQRYDALEPAELERLLKNSYQMVLDKLPKKVKQTLNQK